MKQAKAIAIKMTKHVRRGTRQNLRRNSDFVELLPALDPAFAFLSIFIQTDLKTTNGGRGCDPVLFPLLFSIIFSWSSSSPSFSLWVSFRSVREEARAS